MKRLSALHPRIQKKIAVQGASEVGSCWIWLGSSTGPRFKPVYAKPGTIHRPGERAATFARRLPTVWSPDHGYAVPAHRKIYCDLGDVPYHLMPECTRCANEMCVNPHHVKTRGKHRVQLQPDLTHAIKARTKETREAVWARLMEIQPHFNLSAQCMADECGLTEVSEELLQEYTKWYVANPHLIRDDDDYEAS